MPCSSLGGDLHGGLCPLPIISTGIKNLRCTWVHGRAVIASVPPVWGGASDILLGQEKVRLCLPVHCCISQTTSFRHKETGWGPREVHVYMCHFRGARWLWLVGASAWCFPSLGLGSSDSVGVSQIPAEV